MKKTVTKLLCTYGIRMLRASFFILCSLLFSPAGAQTQSGKASFYSKRATGSRTANGERLHHDSMTCAHRTYPFGTMLKVTNMANGKEVVVRVTDRGPYRKGRIIDLSWGAAKAIGMIAQGITQVKVERLSPGFVVPFKPEESPLNQPIYEFEIAEIEDTATPIWKVDEKIDDKKAKSQMRKTATDARRARSATTAAPTDTKAVPQAQPVTTDTKKAQPVTTDTKKAQPVTTDTKKTPQKEAATPTDVLDEINSQPNRSKAYLKRQGKK